MKKILILMLLLVMTLCFTACGGLAGDTAATSVDTAPTQAISVDAASANATAADAAADDQALIDADYNQLLTFVADLQNHDAMLSQLADTKDQYVAGSISDEDLINMYQQISDASQQLLTSLQSLAWGSDNYNDQISLLSDAIEALAQSDAFYLEAIQNNDDSKLTDGDTYRATYTEKIDEFLTAMGV